MIYYLIQAYSKEVDGQYEKHLYPSYLTSYNMVKGGDAFGLQSGLYDALKFTDAEVANEWKIRGEEIFGKTREFDIVPIDSRILGKVTPRYVVEN